MLRPCDVAEVVRQTADSTAASIAAKEKIRQTDALNEGRIAALAFGPR
jgi:hypothetical protein